MAQPKCERCNDHGEFYVDGIVDYTLKFECGCKKEVSECQ